MSNTMGSQGLRGAKQTLAETKLTPYLSPEYLGILESLGKEIKTNRFVEQNGINVHGLAFCQQRLEVLFTLSEIDGEETFVLKDEKTENRTYIEGANLPDTNTATGARPAVNIASKIKVAQSYALKAYANLCNSPFLFPIHKDKSASDAGLPTDQGPSTRIVDGNLYDFLPVEPPSLLFFSSKDIKEKAGVNDLEGLAGHTKYLSAKGIELPNGTREFDLVFKTELYSKKNKEHFPFSLANIPVLRWGMPISTQPNSYNLSGNLTSLRNFRWELIFPRSSEVLGSAAWNDLEGIQGLIDRMQDTDDLQTQQVLCNPKFFLS